MSLQNRRLGLVVVGVCTLVAILSTVSYAAFDGAVVTNKNIDTDMSAGSRVVFTSSEAKEFTFERSMYDGNTIQGEDIIKIIATSVYDKKTVCSYDILWKWNTNYGIFADTSDDNIGFNVSGYRDENDRFDNVEILSWKDAKGGQVIKSSEIVIDKNTSNTEKEQVWNLSFSFPYEGYNHEYHNNNLYKGSFSIENVMCHD